MRVNVAVILQDINQQRIWYAPGVSLPIPATHATHIIRTENRFNPIEKPCNPEISFMFISS